MRSVAVLALLWTAAGAALFRSRLVEHAQTPLRSAGGVSGIQCASLCLWTSDCVGWSRDPHTGACRLWPPASAQNPLTPLKELVFQSRLIAVPDGFTVSDDPKVAYNIIMIVASLYKESFVAACHAKHPDAFPAVPSTTQQFEYLKAAVPNDATLYVGIYRDTTMNVFKSMADGQTMEPPSSWWIGGSVLVEECCECIAMTYEGIYPIICSAALHGYICQYNL